MSAQPYSLARCQEILDETRPLLGVYLKTRPALDRLQQLMDTHFQDNSEGNDFRSYCCFGTPGQSVSLETFNELVILPATLYCVQLEQSTSCGPIGPSCLLPAQKEFYLQDFVATATKSITLVLQEMIKGHPRMEEILAFIPINDGIPHTWSREILGNGGNKNKPVSPESLPTLSVLRDRIGTTINRTFAAKDSDPLLRFFCKETGALWQTKVDDHVDADAIILQASSEFSQLLQKLLDDSGETFDVLAGVKPSQRYPDVEEVILAGFAGAQQKGMESKDLLLEDGSLGGTVIAMHNEGFLSAEWIAAYLVDMDQNHFMVDERAKSRNNKERYLRISSSIHDFEKPTWMQFGKTKGVYLYMSQRASAAEEGWLTIVSFIVNLLIDDINKRLESVSGGRFKLEQRKFDVVVGNLADPSRGPFARHQDGFPGLIDPLVPGFRRFDLIVPTSAIQNHFAPTTRISWFRKRDDKNDKSQPEVGFFVHDFLIQHWQLPGVNHYFEHEVTSTLKGPVDPNFLLNFQLVDKSAVASTQQAPPKTTATLRHPKYDVPPVDSSCTDTPTNEAPIDAVPKHAEDALIANDSGLHLGDGSGDRAKKPILSVMAKRLGLSGRRTLQLQGSGLTTIHEQVTSKEISEDPILHGYDEHYNRVGCWRSPNFGVVSRSTAAFSDEQLELMENRPLTLSNYLNLNQAPTTEPVEPIPSFEFNKFLYVRRRTDKKFWPTANVNAISSRKNLAETLTYGPVMRPLALEGIIPIVRHPNPKDAKQTISVTFGPPLDDENNPIRPGERLEASVVYEQLRMKNAVDHHDAWHSAFWNADGLNLRLPPKSGLPTNCEISAGLSPIGELLRIDSRRARLGFPTHGSGGNPVINGLAPPDAKARKTSTRDAAEGATFETSQSVLNKMNRTMLQVCESGRPVKVYLSGDMLPKCFYDQELANKIGAQTEQSVYMGMYTVKWGAQTDPLQGSDLLEIVSLYKQYYPDLKRDQLRFHLAGAKSFFLVPNENYVDRRAGYQHLHVDTRDDRKPFYEIPKGSTIDNIFRGLEDSTMVSEISLFLDWVRGRGYLELVERPYIPVVHGAVALTVNTGGSQVLENAELQAFVANMRTLDTDEVEVRVAKDMARRCRRFQTKDEHFHNLVLCSLGSFARMCLMNVDVQSKIGPLIDFKPECHGATTTALENYTDLFGRTDSRYLSRLGRPIQMSPITHPIRTYDPKCLLLMQANSGAMGRQLRHGVLWMRTNFDEAVDLFLHCIIIEVVKVEVLVEWSNCFHGNGTSRLPSLSEIPRFLDFIAAALLEKGAVNTKVVNQDQYQINGNFNDKKIFDKFFLHLHSQLSPWLLRQVQPEAVEQPDLFRATTKCLTKFISGGLVDSYAKQPFHSQHMLLNLNEVVADFPFGTPVTPVVGFGGKFGGQLLQENEFKTTDDEMVGEVMSNLLLHYSQRSTSELTLMGLKKIGAQDGVVVSINGRPIGLCDPEHGCCVQYPVVERASGGSKGMSKEPKLVSSFCHPIKGCKFNNGEVEAKKALLEFKGLVDTKLWQGLGENDDDSTDDDSTVEEDSDKTETSASESDEEDSDETEDEAEIAVEVFCSDQESQDIGAKAVPEQAKRTIGTRNRRHLQHRKKAKSKVDAEGQEDLDDYVGDYEPRQKSDEEDSDETEDEAQIAEGDDDVGDIEPRRKKRKLSSNNLPLSYDSGTAVLDEEAQAGGPISQATETVRERDNSDKIHLNGGVHMENFKERGRDEELHVNDVNVVGGLDQFGVAPATASNFSAGSPHLDGTVNLMLAMIYGEHEGSFETVGNMKDAAPQLRRDTARCIATEQLTGLPVYTMDNRSGTCPTDRHMRQNLSKINLMDPTMVKITGRVHQICLDYFWFSSAYWDERLGILFYTESMLEFEKLLAQDGLIYLPLSVHILFRVLENRTSLEIHFNISLVHETEVEEIDLVKGSHQIPDEMYCSSLLGGKDSKPESARGTTFLEITRTVTVSDKKFMLDGLVKFAQGRETDDCRFIRFQKMG